MERGSSRGVSRVGVVGGGVVGRATGIGFAHLGHQVVFCDIDAGVVDRLRSRGYEAVFPQDMPRQRLDVTILCVNTPTVGSTISLSRLDAACETVGSIVEGAQSYHLVEAHSGQREGQLLRQDIHHVGRALRAVGPLDSRSRPTKTRRRIFEG